MPSTYPTYTNVHAISPDDVWAVGGGPRPVAHWNGKHWQRLSADASGVAALHDVAASGPNNVWIVGGPRPFVTRFDGRRFTKIPIPRTHWGALDAKHIDTPLWGVLAISPRNVWAVGIFGVEHYTGRGWERVRRDDWWAIAAAGRSDLWAVGGSDVLRYTCR